MKRTYNFSHDFSTLSQSQLADIHAMYPLAVEVVYRPAYRILKGLVEGGAVIPHLQEAPMLNLASAKEKGDE